VSTRSTLLVFQTAIHLFPLIGIHAPENKAEEMCRIRNRTIKRWATDVRGRRKRWQLARCVGNLHLASSRLQVLPVSAEVDVVIKPTS